MVIDEILNEINSVCDLSTYEYLKNFITIKFHNYKIVKKEETGLIEYKEDKNQLMIKKFMITKKLQGLSEKSIKAYYSEIVKLLSNVKKDVDAISTDDIKYYLACLQIKGLSNATVDNTRRFLSSFFQFLEDEEVIKKNIVKKIKTIKQKKSIKKPFSAEEIEKLKLACDSKRKIAIIEILLATGVRVNELVNIKISDINFKENEIKILGKGNKERYVYLTAGSKIRVLDYLKNRKGENIYLFQKEIGKLDQLNSDYIATMLKEIGGVAKVENVHPHRFRRTCATMAHRRGMKIEEIQKMLGHASLSTTQIYVEVDNLEVKRAHQKYMN